MYQQFQSIKTDAMIAKTNISELQRTILNLQKENQEFQRTVLNLQKENQEFNTSISELQKKGETSRIMSSIAPDWDHQQALELNKDVTITRYGWILMINLDDVSFTHGYINNHRVYSQHGYVNTFSDFNSIKLIVKN